ncbi:hypothetical protein [Phytohabitans aurantiacus]|uniref:Uncharacterized protein n=1 Tax=Phytohabitans aurantiacus TaxID=3016789 RepID=A0ABQ5R944_9ACTN|nr:hypothetical protein [Phytohabitans aurantiacus]GLI03287.1 hypothetical protein Pa4123_85650 [Phytohabitans aurantiacus]
MAEIERRRRRLRRDGGDAPTATTAEIAEPDAPVAAPAPARVVPEEREAERGLRGLVGSGSSQVGTSAALRARDAARPTDADLAEAEERLVIVRRNWVPPR